MQLDFKRQPADPPQFSQEFRDDFARLLTCRRDVRHFRGEPVDSALVRLLLQQAMLAPSVGYSQPWRWVIVEDPEVRVRIAQNHAEAKALAGTNYGPERATQYNGLKLAGLQQAPVHIAVFADAQTSTGHGLGRKSMPETVVWSAMMAIHTLWLGATAQGLGLGWVSILDPSAVAAILDVPSEWTFLAYLCVGWPEEYPERPLLETQNWEQRKDFDSVVFTR